MRRWEILCRGWLVATAITVSAGFPVTARAEEPSQEPRVQFKAGIGSWLLSRGETKWNHDVSRLTYKDEDTNIIEFSGQVTWNKRWFARGTYGFGDMGGGELIDDDFNDPNGPVLSRTKSDIRGNSLWYVNGDAGAIIYSYPGHRGTLGIFGGVQYWRQQHRAVGVVQQICVPSLIPCSPANNGQDLAPGQTAITNTAQWLSLRLGVETEYRLTRRFSVAGKVAFIPLTYLHNEDIHHLRQTAAGGLPALQQDPSFKMTGFGVGANVEGAASYVIVPRLVASIGYRFWWNQVRDGTFTSYPVGSPPAKFNLEKFETFQHGMTLGLTYLF